MLHHSLHKPHITSLPSSLTDGFTWMHYRIPYFYVVIQQGINLSFLTKNEVCSLRRTQKKGVNIHISIYKILSSTEILCSSTLNKSIKISFFSSLATLPLTQTIFVVYETGENYVTVYSTDLSLLVLLTSSTEARIGDRQLVYIQGIRSNQENEGHESHLPLAVGDCPWESGMLRISGAYWLPNLPALVKDCKELLINAPWAFVWPITLALPLPHPLLSFYISPAKVGLVT